MAVLGVGEHRLLGLPDLGLDEHDERGADLVGRLIDEIGPDTILTFGPDGATYHPDHVAVHRWVTAAWDRRDRPGRLLYAAASVDHLARFRDVYEEWGMYMSDERPTGVPGHELAVHLHLHGASLDRKLTALRSMATQTSGLLQVVDPDVYAQQVAEESFVDAAVSPGRSPAGRGRVAPSR
jgi:LmbE family N-acetylglucosaminyl deacetylase